MASPQSSPRHAVPAATRRGGGLPLLALAALLSGACGRGQAAPRWDATVPEPQDDFGNAPIDTGMPDGGPGERPGSDAFFIMDDPPPFCGPDGEREEPRPPGGTAECPDDKNREGCACPEEGLEAACWPGRRENRNHGICEDGMTRCEHSREFGLLWGPCFDYVLPVEGVLSGPEACRCFSNGKWQFDNLVPCPVQQGEDLYFYSSRLDDDGRPQCDGVTEVPPPVPEAPWGLSTLNVDCAGNFRLCYAIKAGDKDNPDPSDCTVMEQCFDVWYEDAGDDVPIEVPGWRSDNGECGRAFRDEGGYGEMSVQGLSIECNEIDDGQGEPLVFFRTSYCPSDCGDRPDAPQCRGCATGGAGDF